MQTPYELLGVTATASDNEIKQAYLQKVKDNPPDRDQEQFQVIHTAYTAIKNPKNRLNYALFSLPTTDFDTLLAQAFPATPVPQINAEQFTRLLKVSLDETNLQNALTPTQSS